MKKALTAKELSVLYQLFYTMEIEKDSEDCDYVSFANFFDSSEVEVLQEMKRKFVNNYKRQD